MRVTVQSTKDLPIREIDREAFKRRKEKHQKHKQQKEGAAENPESSPTEVSYVGKDVLEKVLREKYEEKLEEEALPKLPAEQVWGTKLERVPDRDEKLEK
jgi:hypothetical protein